MYRLISFIVIFSFVAVLLHFHNENSHYTASSHTDHHTNNKIEIPINMEQIPSVTGEMQQDYSDSWFIYIEPTNFTFAPDKVGLDEIHYNEGHAHLYINGEKMNRIYDNYYNIGILEEGIHEIKVTLHGNNHGVFVYKGNPISYIETVKVG